MLIIITIKKPSNVQKCCFGHIVYIYNQNWISYLREYAITLPTIYNIVWFSLRICYIYIWILNFLSTDIFFIFLHAGPRNGLLPFPLSTDFINNYRRLYGPVQLTSIVSGGDKVPNRTQVDSKHFKGKARGTVHHIHHTCIRIYEYGIFIWPKILIFLQWQSLLYLGCS